MAEKVSMKECHNWWQSKDKFTKDKKCFVLACLLYEKNGIGRLFVVMEYAPKFRKLCNYLMELAENDVDEFQIFYDERGNPWGTFQFNWLVAVLDNLLVSVNKFEDIKREIQFNLDVLKDHHETIMKEAIEKKELREQKEKSSE